MSPEQLKMYAAICEADPECRCPLVEYVPNYWREPFSGAVDGVVSNELAEAAIRDHLHTWLGIQEDEGPYDQSATIGYSQGEWFAVGPIIDSFGIRKWESDHHKTKLDALLAAHAARLGVGRVRTND